MNGIDCFFEGFSLVRRPGLRQYVVIPALNNTIMLVVVLAGTASQFGGWVAYLMSYLPEWLAFLEWLVWFLSLIIVILTLAYAFVFVASIVASPFNAVLSIKVEEMLLGRELTSSVSVWMILPRTVAREIGKLAYLLPRLLLLLVISVIPVINVISPFLWLLFGAWMMAIQFTDYAADNNEVSFSDLKSRLGSSRLQSVLFGLPLYVLVAIPVVNLVALPVGVAGGTVFWFHHLRAQGPAR